MKRKVYLVVEHKFLDDLFTYEHDHQYFTSKNAAALWMEREKIQLINQGWSIINEDIENCQFSAKLDNYTSHFNLWSGIPQ